MAGNQAESPPQNTNTRSRRGRPLKFESIDKLKKDIAAYFADCDPHPEKQVRYEWHIKKVTKKDAKTGEEYEVEENDYSKKPKTVEFWGISKPKPYTITGLAVWLGTSRVTLLDYEGEGHQLQISEAEQAEFTYTIKAAKDRIEDYWEHHLIGPNVAGIIFSLKNNYEWKDRTETDLTSGGDKIHQGMSLEEIDEVLARANQASTTPAAGGTLPVSDNQDRHEQP